MLRWFSVIFAFAMSISFAAYLAFGGMSQAPLGIGIIQGNSGSGLVPPTLLTCGGVTCTGNGVNLSK